MPDISLMAYHLIMKIVLRDNNFFLFYPGVKDLGLRDISQGHTNYLQIQIQI